MATIPGLKLDDGLPGYSANCFPVRGLIRQAEEGEGAWLVAHRAEQRRRFKAILCNKPKTYARIKEERKKAEKEGATPSDQNGEGGEEEGGEDEKEEAPVLDGFFLMKHCCVEDPSDLCSVNISGKEISEVKEEDLALFDNVAYVNASENFLPFEAFRGFPILRELEMPLNGLRSIHPKLDDYANLENIDLYTDCCEIRELYKKIIYRIGLESCVGFSKQFRPGSETAGHSIRSESLRVAFSTGMKENGDTFRVLDVSYNNLSQEDVLTIGLLSNLKVLHLTGNGFKTLPVNMAMPFYDPDSKREVLRYNKLEILLLDDNKLSDVSVFAALAGLSRLKHLNMEKNELYYVPMLKSVEGKVIPNDDEKEKKRLRRSADRAGRRSAKGSRSRSQQEVEKKEEEEGETTVPKPTPVPPSTDTEQLTSDKLTSDSKTEQSGTGTTDNGDLLTEDFSSLSRQVTEIDLEKEVAQHMREEEKKQVGDGSELPPFPDLRLLNLAHNKIEDEEALLAVAAWPMLVELIIHDNPLTTENSGDPPLLQRFLGERLGIKIVRKRDTGSKKPNVEVKQRKSRMVTTVVPKIPKIDVDHLLMLEAPKPPTQPKPERVRTKSKLEASKPLPPIPSSPVDGPRSEVREKLRSTLKEEKKEPMKTEEQDADAFFMTQVDDQQEEPNASRVPAREAQKKIEEDSNENRYKGYEVLLDLEEDPNYSPPKDMHGNIKALKYALRHELIYRDPVARLDRISKPVEPYRKSDVPSGPPRVTKGQKKEMMLLDLCNRVTTEEVGLDEVLEADTHLRKRFPDAERLLGEIQRKYNTVRVNSMKEAKDAKKVMAGTLQEVAAKKPETASRRVKMEV